MSTQKDFTVFLAIIGFGCIFAGCYQLFLKHYTEAENLDYLLETDAFFISNQVYDYALFKEDGSQLTDFIYGIDGNFYNHSTVVNYADNFNRYEIINDEGEVLVSSDRYDEISQYGPLYEGISNSKEPYQHHLINQNGEILLDLNDNKIVETDDDDLAIVIDNLQENQYDIINYNGKKILSIPKVENVQTIDTSLLDNRIFLLFYNHTCWAIDLLKEKVIVTFQAEKTYAYVSDNYRIIILPNEKKVVKNKKVYDLSNQCVEIYYQYNHFYCKQGNQIYFLNNQMKPVDNISKKIFMDESSYIERTKGKDDVPTVRIYQNGIMMKSLECYYFYSSINPHQYNAYLVTPSSYGLCKEKNKEKKGKYEYYRSNGLKLTNKFYEDANSFDEYNRAIVSEDGENYYLIDSNGKKISDMYQWIMDGYEGYYKVNNDNKYGVIDVNGKEVVPVQYQDVDVNAARILYDDATVIAQLNDTEYVIYNLDRGTISSPIQIIKEQPEKNNVHIYAMNHYIYVTEINKYNIFNYTDKYYTYDGTLFYTNSNLD